jgi:hypothetical protein
MGAASLDRALRLFDVEKVNAVMLEALAASEGTKSEMPDSREAERSFTR